MKITLEGDPDMLYSFFGKFCCHPCRPHKPRHSVVIKFAVKAAKTNAIIRSNVMDVTLANNLQQQFDLEFFTVVDDPNTTVDESVQVPVDPSALTAVSSDDTIAKAVLSSDNKMVFVVGQGKDGVADITVSDANGASGIIHATMVDPKVVAIDFIAQGTQPAGTPIP